MNKLVEKLKELRWEKRLLQKDVAKALKVPLNTYSNYEQGACEPNIDTLIALAHFFNVSVGYLVGDED